MLMLDTDILIWILRGRQDEMLKFEKYTREHEGIICITPIQVSEIYAGMKEQEEIETSLFLQRFHLVDLDFHIGVLAGKFMNKYQKSHSVTMSDALIAAACKMLGVSLWTYNTKHYPMLSGDDLKE